MQVTLKPGEQVTKWRFAKLTGADDGEQINGLMRDPKDTRERMAVLMTSPENRRFARVVVNRVWNRLMGAGFVEPVHDWESGCRHPELSTGWHINSSPAATIPLPSSASFWNPTPINALPSKAISPPLPSCASFTVPNAVA